MVSGGLPAMLGQLLDQLQPSGHAKTAGSHQGRPWLANPHATAAGSWALSALPSSPCGCCSAMPASLPVPLAESLGTAPLESADATSLSQLMP